MSVDCERDSSHFLDTESAFSHGVGSGNWTVSLWVKPESKPAADVYCWAINGPNPGLYIRSSANDKFGCNFGGLRDFNAAISTGVWTHLAVRRTGTSLEGYINGVKEGTTHTVSGSMADDVALEIGGDGAGGSTFDGLIEDAAFWSTALRSAEIASLAAGRLRAWHFSQSLKGYWPLHAPGDAVYDAAATGDLGLSDFSGRGFRLAASGGAVWSEDRPGLNWPTRARVFPGIAAASGTRRISLGGVWLGGGRVVLAG